VQYGKYGSNGGLCPDTTENTQSDANVITSGTEIEIKAAEKCMWPQALQVSLWQIYSFIMGFLKRKNSWKCKWMFSTSIPGQILISQSKCCMSLHDS